MAAPTACYAAPQLTHLPGTLPIEDDLRLATLTVHRHRAGRGLRATTTFPDRSRSFGLLELHGLAGGDARELIEAWATSRMAPFLG
jgi:hypothetical protein